MSQKYPRDTQIEEYLTTVIGCASVTFLPEVEVERLDCAAYRQKSRLTANDSDYLAGIEATITQGLSVRPVIIRKRGKKGEMYALLDGIHRVIVCKRCKRPTISAYLVECTDEQADIIATTANVRLNGQGLSEAERRVHFLSYLRQTSPTLGESNLMRRGITQTMAALLSVSMETARRWVGVDRMRARAERLGLSLPKEREAGVSGARGERGDSWLLAVSDLTDEELVKYWPRLTAATAAAVRQMTRDLKSQTSAAKRSVLAEQLSVALIPNVRVMSQTDADRERRAAQQIRSHGAGLLKLQGQFVGLAAKYADVAATLKSVAEILREQGFMEDKDAAVAAHAGRRPTA